MKRALARTGPLVLSLAVVALAYGWAALLNVIFP